MRTSEWTARLNEKVNHSSDATSASGTGASRRAGEPHLPLEQKAAGAIIPRTVSHPRAVASAHRACIGGAYRACIAGINLLPAGRAGRTWDAQAAKQRQPARHAQTHTQIARAPQKLIFHSVCFSDPRP